MLLGLLPFTFYYYAFLWQRCQDFRMQRVCLPFNNFGNYLLLLTFILQVK